MRPSPGSGPTRPSCCWCSTGPRSRCTATARRAPSAASSPSARSRAGPAPRPASGRATPSSACSRPAPSSGCRSGPTSAPASRSPRPIPSRGCPTSSGNGRQRSPITARPLLPTVSDQVQRDVAAHRAARDDALAFALLRQEAEAGSDRRARAAQREPPALDADLARVGPVDAGDEAQELRAARADEARDAEHLALAEPEADVAHGRPVRQAGEIPGPTRGLPACQAGDLEDDLVPGEPLVLRGRQLAPDHAGDDLALGRV